MMTQFIPFLVFIALFGALVLAHAKETISATQFFYTTVIFSLLSLTLQFNLDAARRMNEIMSASPSHSYNSSFFLVLIILAALIFTFRTMLPREKMATFIPKLCLALFCFFFVFVVLSLPLFITAMLLFEQGGAGFSELVGLFALIIVPALPTFCIMAFVITLFKRGKISLSPSLLAGVLSPFVVILSEIFLIQIAFGPSDSPAIPFFMAPSVLSNFCITVTSTVILLRSNKGK